MDWIQCDDCDQCFHHKCVHVRKSRAEQLPRYSCLLSRKFCRDNHNELLWRNTSVTPNICAGTNLTRAHLHDAQLQDADYATFTKYIHDATLPDDPRKAKSIEKHAQEYRLDNGVLLYYTQSAWCIVVPKALQRDVIECHSKPVAGHQGRTKTINRLWWKGMSADVRSFIRACRPCHATKPVFRKPAGIMLLTHSSEPCEVVDVDLMGPLPKSYAGHEDLLVAVDHFIIWCEIFSIKKATGIEHCMYPCTPTV